MKTLLLGCGGKRDKIIVNNSVLSWAPIEGDLVTIDINPDHKPDVVHDLNVRPLPFADNTFDEIHAYEVLEHVGKQGDYKAFFAEFSEYWRILKPGGTLTGTCPHYKSAWAWGDPSHVRVIPLESFVFLDQDEYVKQVGKTPMSDFRYIYKAHFKAEMGAYVGTDMAVFKLRAVK